MQLTPRGYRVVAVFALLVFLGFVGLAGMVETQADPNCEDYQAAQDWELALHNGCPFTDDSGNYLYTWEPK